MKLRMSLSAKILAWFLLNLVLLGAVAALFAWRHFQPGWNWLVSGAAAERVQKLSSLVVEELEPQPMNHWNRTLRRITEAYGVPAVIFSNDGRQLAGDPMTLPAEVLAKLDVGRHGREEGPPREGTPPPQFEGRPPPFEHHPPGGQGPPHPTAGGAPNDYPKFVVHAGEPPRYWIGVRAPITGRNLSNHLPCTLFFVADSLGAGGLLLDPRPWLWMVLVVIGVSVLFWLPLVRGITGALRRMMSAAEAIAEGRFQTRVELNRRDELGRVSTALNHMAARLQEHFNGQKRFLGDIAHELCGPLSRMEMALGVLEQRADENQRAYVGDVLEEVHNMSALVNELLAFSKAAVTGNAVAPRPVPLRELAAQSVQREAAGHAGVCVEIEETLQASADPALLSRALGNVIRNAVRYANGSGPITIRAVPQDRSISLSVADSGPGVPEESLPRLFDAFYRPDASRDRETGGAGLGLAIVKTCIEACGGCVNARNRAPHGLEIEFTLLRCA